MAKARITVAVIAAIVALSACDRNRVPELMNLRKGSAAPDEFAILPTMPLTQPETYAELPTPTPGGANRTDRNPRADAVAALGGRPGAGSSGHGALIASAGRYGVAQDIRSVTAAEDLEYRRANDGRPIERLFNINVYYKAYRAQSLDQHVELERLRRAGIRTVAAPPDPSLDR